MIATIELPNNKTELAFILEVLKRFNLKPLWLHLPFWFLLCSTTIFFSIITNLKEKCSRGRIEGLKI